MSSWSGPWLYIKMVSLHLISNRTPPNFVLEKKLAIVLKTLLALEATAKVVLVVKAVLIQKGTPPRHRCPIYDIIYCYLQLLWAVSLQITHSAETPVTNLPPYISRTGMIFMVTVPKHECLTVLQVYSTRIWCPASNSGSVQGSRVMEA